MQIFTRFQEHRKQRFNVVTLALGSWPKLGMTKELGSEKGKVVLVFKHIPTSGKMQESESQHPIGFPLWKLKELFQIVLKLWNKVWKTKPCSNWTFFRLMGKVSKNKYYILKSKI
jgi:hypothetical protein